MYAPVSYPPNISPVAMEGVTCDVCHTISGNENFGKDISAGIYLYPRKGETAVKYGQRFRKGIRIRRWSRNLIFLKQPIPHAGGLSLPVRGNN